MCFADLALAGLPAEDEALLAPTWYFCDDGFGSILVLNLTNRLIK